MCPRKCGGVSLGFTVWYGPKTFLSGIQLNLSVVAQVGVLVCAEGLTLSPALTPHLQACTMPHLWPAAAWESTWPSEAEQFTTSSSQQPRGFSSQFPSAMGWGRVGSPFIMQLLPLCREFGPGHQQQIQLAGKQGIQVALWPGFAALLLRSSRSDPTTSGFN